MTPAPLSGISMALSDPPPLEPPLATDFKSEIAARVLAEKGSAAWANYLKVRDAICVMMDDWERLDPEGGPSAYWREEIEGFLYLFDASPLLVSRPRAASGTCARSHCGDGRGDSGTRTI